MPRYTNDVPERRNTCNCPSHGLIWGRVPAVPGQPASYRMVRREWHVQNVTNTDCPGRCCQAHPAPPSGADINEATAIWVCPTTQTRYAYCEYSHGGVRTRLRANPGWVTTHSYRIHRYNRHFCCAASTHGLRICNGCINLMGMSEGSHRPGHSYFYSYCDMCMESECECYVCLRQASLRPRPLLPSTCPTCQTSVTNLCLDSEQYVCKCRGDAIVSQGGQVYWYEMEAV